MQLFWLLITVLYVSEFCGTRPVPLTRSDDHLAIDCVTFDNRTKIYIHSPKKKRANSLGKDLLRRTKGKGRWRLPRSLSPSQADFPGSKPDSTGGFFGLLGSIATDVGSYIGSAAEGVQHQAQKPEIDPNPNRMAEFQVDRTPENPATHDKGGNATAPRIPCKNGETTLLPWTLSINSQLVLIFLSVTLFNLF